MKKTLLFSLIIVSALILGARLGFKPAAEALGFKEKAGLKITAVPEAMVSIDGVAVGKTPYQSEDLKVGSLKVRLEGGGGAWEGSVKLTNGTLSVVGRELAANTASASGEILTLDSGKGVTITSIPDGAGVEIDGKTYGVTPLVVSDIVPGDHTFILSHANFTKRSIKAVLPQNMSLMIAVDLAVSEAEAVNFPVPQVIAATKLIIKQTPTGFLRVRDKPNLSGAEIGRLSAGDSVVQLEELSGWVKIRLENSTEGYISSQYVQKQL
ncbi:hypothetical protein A3A14_01325 [Candidatus Daviesbacteria bacterium RIFCSPLOWO2_01_FULL_43_38]|uniref:SH3b domain-containing protein n=3 Tax=Candidatus Daviesiibacteriota TaxID=1752718 RepID=A0A1F5K7G1_9BACT|nr:MAG: PEGA domain protein [Candidatus Daviesbacteria bacterium GW2011_GWA1_42_6]KKS70277.1 MAG: PEGA domain protein [Candidatus Daviesbacteria bacterium GW2011_GWA2_42_7]OGE18983.1 MAG: hypothetical protein A2874_02390 [Candidatus Daviesbacteria bacterium RIFCSPHIGHO2_01_FULL_43_17]OGE36872.1 MAG: hypothetical protein A3E45_03450 [Candidatus Daviesbacteria bacterium RIFCSPHIGHO2_12_FULL_43_11]OGE63298.1 MAG: hypothetical protein A3A14_01325 [Candidatus Daviesbacteria bacterium RIFCSPLOWO2_01_